MPDLSQELERLVNEYVDSLPWYRRWAWKAWLLLNPIKPQAGGLGCLLAALLAVVVFLILRWVWKKYGG